MREFFQAVWPTPPPTGNLAFWFKQTKRTRHVPIGYLAQLTDTDVAELQAINLGSNPKFPGPQDAYYGLALRRDGLTPNQQGGRDDCLWLPGFMMDIDLALPEAEGAAHSANNLPTSAEQAFRLFSHMPDPTAVVDSGYGLQVFWRFREPLALTRTSASVVESQYQTFWQGFADRATAQGWHVDKGMRTVQRVWRVPGLTNHKIPGTLRPTRNLYLDKQAAFEIRQLVTVPQGVTQLPGSAVASTTTAEPGLVPLADVSRGGGATALPPEAEPVVAILQRLRNPESLALMAKVLAGESFAAPGDRDRLLQKVTSILAWVGPEVPTFALAAIMERSLAVWAAEPGATRNLVDEMAKATDKIERNKRDWARKNGDSLKALREALGISPFAQPGEPSSADPPTSAEIARVLRHLIIQYRTAFYVWDFRTNAYGPVQIKDELPQVMRDNLADSVVELTYETEPRSKDAAPVTKLKTVPMLLRDYSTVAKSLIMDLTLQASKYDPGASRFYEATAPLRKLEPREDAMVSAWLGKLGGDHVGKLLDWIAVVTQLVDQNAMLILESVKGTGKGLLALGLARLWHDGGPTEMKQALGSFNADIATCPLILLDEGIPESFGDITQALRALIGTSTHTLTRKFLPNAPLRGAIRAIAAANNDAILQLGDRPMTLADLDATVDRTLHLHVTPEAAEFLKAEKLKDPGLTKRWIEEDVIARHALWLRDSRVVVPDDRFLVQGSPTTMHAKLATQGHQVNLVLEWIARFVMNSGELSRAYTSKKEEPLARVGAGKILVNTQGVVDCWMTYMRPDFKMPSLKRVGEILRNIAIGEERHPAEIGRRYHSIKPDVVLQWAIENQVGDDAQILARVQSPVLTSVPAVTPAPEVTT